MENDKTEAKPSNGAFFKRHMRKIVAGILITSMTIGIMGCGTSGSLCGKNGCNPNHPARNPLSRR